MADSRVSPLVLSIISGEEGVNLNSLSTTARRLETCRIQRVVRVENVRRLHPIQWTSRCCIHRQLVGTSKEDNRCSPFTKQRFLLVYVITRQTEIWEMAEFRSNPVDYLYSMWSIDQFLFQPSFTSFELCLFKKTEKVFSTTLKNSGMLKTINKHCKEKLSETM